MASPLNSLTLVSRVRTRVGDRGPTQQQLWTDTMILEAADDCLQTIWDEVRHAGQDHELDRIEVPVASFTRIEEGWYEYELPEWVGAIRKVEGVTGGTPQVFEVLDTELDNKDIPRMGWVAGRPRWARSKLGRSGTLGIFGGITVFPTVRLWFIRKWPPLHFGTAAAGALGTITFPASATAGRVVARDSLYVGVDIEITAGVPVPVDEMRRVTAYAGSTRVATVSPSWSIAPTNQTQYALVVPLESEHGSYMIETVARALLERRGDEKQLAATLPRYIEIKERFHASLRRRDQIPKRIWSRRR